MTYVPCSMRTLNRCGTLSQLATFRVSECACFAVTLKASEPAGSGGFDEALLSCTDRDFCIRLFEDPAHKWERLDKHLVHHDARKSGRISDSGSERKKQGLQRFAMKHQFRMSEDQWLDFLEISKNRFGTDIEDFSSLNSELDNNAMEMLKRFL